MSGEEKFDVIIIGAGPAGSACAYTLAKAGKSVLIIERGDSPGCKNMTGGRLYTYALELLEPGLYRQAALERRVSREQLMLLGEISAVTVDYHTPVGDEAGQAPVSFTVLRAVFDEWLAAKAEEMGAILACGIKVDQLIENDNHIMGVIAGQDEIYADMVIAADGVNSFMAAQAGLIEDIHKESMGIGVKEVLELPAAVIEERFNLSAGEGAARLFLGGKAGIHGGGFLYTNQNSLSLGAVFMPAEIAATRKPVLNIFQELKTHPAISPLIAGGKTVEYAAHLVNEAGLKGVPAKLYRQGFLVIGDAAGFVINNGYSIRGMDLAIISGIAAAKAVIATEDPAAVGPLYLKELRDINLLPTLEAAQGYVEVLDTPWLYDKLPGLANDVFAGLFNISGAVPPPLRTQMGKLLKANRLSLWQLLKLGIKGGRSL